MVSLIVCSTFWMIFILLRTGITHRRHGPFLPGSDDRGTRTRKNHKANSMPGFAFLWTGYCYPSNPIVRPNRKLDGAIRKFKAEIRYRGRGDLWDTSQPARMPRTFFDPRSQWIPAATFAYDFWWYLIANVDFELRFWTKHFSMACPKNQVPDVDGSPFSRPRRYEKYLPIDLWLVVTCPLFGWEARSLVGDWRYE